MAAGAEKPAAAFRPMIRVMTDHRTASRGRLNYERALFCAMNSRFSQIVGQLSAALQRSFDQPGPEPARRRVERVNAQIEAMAHVHSALSRPPALDDDLEDYCRLIAEGFLCAVGRPEISLDLRVDDVRLSPARELRLAYLVCELIAETLDRHPDERSVALELVRRDERELELSVWPFADAAQAAHRQAVLGLLAASLGGAVDLSRPSDGYARVRIPL